MYRIVYTTAMFVIVLINVSYMLQPCLCTRKCVVCCSHVFVLVNVSYAASHIIVLQVNIMYAAAMSLCWLINVSYAASHVIIVLQVNIMHAAAMVIALVNVLYTAVFALLIMQGCSHQSS